MTSKSSGTAFDTSGYSSLVRGNAVAATHLLTGVVIFMPLPTVVELRSGFAFGSKRDRNEADLKRFLLADKVRQVAPDEVTGNLYVSLYSHARSLGKQLSHNDLWIAALCIQYNAELISTDNDFEVFESYPGFTFLDIL